MADKVIFSNTQPKPSNVVDSPVDDAVAGLVDSKMQRDPVKEGQHDAVVEATKVAENTKKHFEGMVETSTSPIFRLSTVSPFVLFPDHIHIDLNKVTIIFNYFFKSQHIHSVFIEDISDVYVETSLLFASLSIADKGYIENEIRVQYLPRDQAVQARRLIQGLIIAKRQGINLIALQRTPQLIEKLEELGEAHSVK